MQEKVGPVPRLRRRIPKRIFTDEEVWEIRTKRIDGATMRELCDQYRCSLSTIDRVLYGYGPYASI